MKVIIAGSRDIADYERVKFIIERLIEIDRVEVTEVVSGCCRGVDKLGERWAEEKGIPIKKFPYISALGKAGGPARNKQMADYADALFAIPATYSRGTQDMIEKARANGLRVYVDRVG